MTQESDLVQAVARAYGESVIINQFQQVLQESSSSIRNTLSQLFSLYALSAIESDLAWFILEVSSSSIPIPIPSLLFSTKADVSNCA